MIVLKAQWFAVSILLSCLLVSVAPDTHAQVYQGKEGYVEFQSEARDETVVGKCNYLQGKVSLDENILDFYVDLTTLKTGIDLRDEHMRENYLETHKYPYAEFYGKMVDKFDPDKDEKQEVTAKGEFTVHGVTREITVDGTIMPTKEGIRLEAKWDLKLDDYNIPIPEVLHYRLSNDLDVRIYIKLEQK